MSGSITPWFGPTRCPSTPSCRPRSPPVGGPRNAIDPAPAVRGAAAPSVAPSRGRRGWPGHKPVYSLERAGSVRASPVGGSGEQRSRHGVSEEAPARGERELVAAPFGQAQLLETRELARVERVPHVGERDRLVEPEAEHQPFRLARLPRELLHVARRAAARLEGLQVAAQRRCVPPAPALDCADRAHAQAEVVMTEPVAEVVLGAQVAATGELGRPAE